MNKINCNKLGFTFAEMVIVMIILAVIVAVTLPMLSGRKGFTPSFDPWKYLEGSNDAIYFLHNAGDTIRVDDTPDYTSNYHIWANTTIHLHNPIDFKVNDETVGMLGSNLSYTYGFGIGYDAIASSWEAIGTNAQSKYGMTIGLNSVSHSDMLGAIGNDSRVEHYNSIVIGKGATSTTIEQLVLGNTANTTYIKGTVSIKNDVTQGSDRRLKKDISKYKSSLDDFDKIKAYNFRYKNDPRGTTRVGFIAQELQKVYPTAVIKDTSKDKYLSVKTEEILYAMVNGTKELYFKNLKMKKENKKLEEKIDKLEKEFNKIVKEKGEAR